jgi:hypothetical protein
MIKDKNIKRQKLKKLFDELKELQEYLDHEGKMRGMCDYSETDMKHFYNILEKEIVK